MKKKDRKVIAKETYKEWVQEKNEQKRKREQKLIKKWKKTQ